jgi:hypothetical protein
MPRSKHRHKKGGKSVRNPGREVRAATLDDLEKEPHGSEAVSILKILVLGALVREAEKHSFRPLPKVFLAREIRRNYYMSEDGDRLPISTFEAVLPLLVRDGHIEIIDGMIGVIVSNLPDLKGIFQPLEPDDLNGAADNSGRLVDETEGVI